MVAAGMTSGRRMIGTRSVAERRREAPQIEAGRIGGTPLGRTPSGDGSRPAILSIGVRGSESMPLSGRTTPPAGSMAATSRGPQSDRQLTQPPARIGHSTMIGMRGTARQGQHATTARLTETTHGITIAETATLGETETGTAPAAGATETRRVQQKMVPDTAPGTTLMPSRRSSKSLWTFLRKRRPLLPRAPSTTMITSCPREGVTTRCVKALTIQETYEPPLPRFVAKLNSGAQAPHG